MFSTSADYLIGKTSEATIDRTIIEKDKTPSLFLLAETCKNFNEAQLERLLAYANKMSEIESSSHKIRSFSPQILHCNKEVLPNFFIS